MAPPAQPDNNAMKIIFCVMPLFRSRLPLVSLEPCLPRLAKTPPTGPDWIHEIKHDGFRIIARRDGEKVRLISRNGKDLTYRFPARGSGGSGAAGHSCIIDGEAIVSDAAGLAVFSPIRSYRNGPGHALRVRPYRDRRQGFALATDRGPQGCAQEANQQQASGIAFNKHFDVEGSVVFHHACKLGCEGIVSKRLGSPYRFGRSSDWIKVKNPAAPAVKREAEEDWR